MSEEAIQEEQEDSALFDSIANEMEGAEQVLDDPQDEPEETPEEDQEESQEEDPEQAPDEIAAIRAQLAEIQRERDEWRHRYQSDEGRFKAAQRTLQEVHQQRQQAPQERGEKEQSELAKQGVEALKQGRFEEFAAEFPEMAAAIEDYNKAREQQIFSKLDQELTPLKEAYQRQRQQDDAAEFNRAAQELASRHPDWEQYNQHTNPDFRDWLAEQPAEIASLYGKPNARSAARLIDFYKMDKGVAQQAPQQTQSKSQKIVQQRQAKLERSSLPQSRQGGVTDDQSDEAMWNSIAAQVDKQFRR